jgi:hypothetical protein
VPANLEVRQPPVAHGLVDPARPHREQRRRRSCVQQRLGQRRRGERKRPTRGWLCPGRPCGLYSVDAMAADLCDRGCGGRLGRACPSASRHPRAHSFVIHPSLARPPPPSSSSASASPPPAPRLLARPIRFVRPPPSPLSFDPLKRTTHLHQGCDGLPERNPGTVPEPQGRPTRPSSMRAIRPIPPPRLRGAAAPTRGG